MVSANNIDFIKLYTQIYPDDTTLQHQRDFFEFDLDYEYLVQIGKWYKINGFLYYNMRRNGKLNFLNVQYGKYLAQEFHATRYKNTLLIRELNKLSAVGIDFILLKGAALIHSVYPDLGIRQMNDIDLLCRKQDINCIVKSLNELGYIQGEYNYSTGTIVQATKKEEYKARMYSHELVRFVKVIDEVVINIDINHEFSWRNPFSNGERLLFDDVAGEYSEELFNHCYLLKPELNLLHLCLHLYNESCLHTFTSKRLIRELSLYRFCDIINIVKTQLCDWSYFLTLAKKFNYQKSTWYALSFTNIIWPGAIPYSVIRELFSEGYTLEDYYQLDGTIAHWQASPFERIFDIISKLQT